MTQAQSKSYGGVKKKLMGAICMLLVASIMVVSSTYAWFTLSTAPEITGISTSVGANGNLEMALLNTATYGDTSLIKSAVGDSKDTAGKSAVTANVTWGNLVDLSDKSYGMTNITLMPAQLNVNDGMLETSPLATAQYGADGRVTEVSGTTVSATYDGTSFKYVQDHQDYGVRAVGESSAITPRQIAFNAAKSGYLSAVAAAHDATVSAVNSNQSEFAGIAIKVLGGDTSSRTYTVKQMQAMKAIAQGMKKDFSALTVALRNAIIAQAAANAAVDDDVFTELNTALATISSPTVLQTKLTNLSGGALDVSTIKAMVDEIAAADTNLGTAIAELDEKIPGGAAVGEAAISNAITKILGNGITHTSIKNDPDDDLPSDVYLTGGALGILAKYNGTFALSTFMVNTHAGYGQLDGTGKKWLNTQAELADLTGNIKNDLKTNTAGATDTNITDFYGYIMDLAFRTNAATSNLQLQTAGINRIYQDGDVTGDALQGAGSTVTMSNAAGLTADQSAKLLSAVRVVFFDPADGTVFGTAGIDSKSINRTADSTKANLYMIESSMTIQQQTISLGQDAYSQDANGVYAIKSDYPAVKENVTYSNYAATLSPAQWKALPAKTTTYTSDAVETTLKADKAAITALSQSTVKKVSVLVYMDGNMIDNSAVPNAATAGMLTMNLQFSSSADLVPMSNANLRKAEKENVTSTLTITGLDSVAVDQTYAAALAGYGAGDTEQSVQWSSSNNAVATVDANGNVKIVGGGSARIVALVRTTHNVYVASKALNVNVASTGAKILVDGKDLGGNDATINVYPGENFGLKKDAVLTAVLDPDNTTDTIKGVKWEGTTGVITVDETGKITECNIGDTAATIKATIATKTLANGDPDYTTGNAKTVTITVQKQAAATAATLSSGGTVTLTAKESADTVVTTVTGLTKPEGVADEIVGVYAASSVSGVDVSVSNDHTVQANASGCNAAANGNIVVVTVTKFGAVFTNVIPVTVNAPVAP